MVGRMTKVHTGEDGELRFESSDVRLYTRIKKNGRWTFRAVPVKDYLFRSAEMPGLLYLVHGVRSVDVPMDE